MRRRDLILTGMAALAAPSARGAIAPVVLELFTSQGCSSCPPADALLGNLAQRPGVIALAWHIDYWENLGWHDRFATHAATARQQTYARNLHGEVFTPALVVNGVHIVVGSDQSAVEAAIRGAAPLPLPVTLTGTPDGFVADIGASPTSLHALRIVYDPQQATDVGAGENQGARLREYRIVRQADMLAEWDGSPRRLTIPPAGSGQGQVILLQTADQRVIGAADTLSASG